MKTKDLELLHGLLLTGSVSEAADRLHMSQPNASKILKKMEEHAGFSLFTREHGRLNPTQEGRILLDQVERTIHSIRHLDQLTKEVREMQHTRLIIGGMPLLSRMWLPNFLSGFLLANKNIKVSLHTRSSQKLTEWVAEGRIDIAVTLLPVDDPTVDRSILMPVEMVAAVPRDHALAKKTIVQPKDLDGVDYISLSFADHARQPLDKLFSEWSAPDSLEHSQEPIKPNERAECSLPAVAIQLAHNGLGVAIIDHLTASEYRGENLVFRPFNPRLSMNIWLLKAKMRPRSRATDLFVEKIRESVEQESLSAPPDSLFCDSRDSYSTRTT